MAIQLLTTFSKAPANYLAIIKSVSDFSQNRTDVTLALYFDAETRANDKANGTLNDLLTTYDVSLPDVLSADRDVLYPAIKALTVDWADMTQAVDIDPDVPAGDSVIEVPPEQ